MLLARFIFYTYVFSGVWAGSNIPAGPAAQGKFFGGQPKKFETVKNFETVENKI